MELLRISVAVVIFLVVVCLAFLRIDNAIELPADLARIEAVRDAVARVPVSAAEDVYGQAADWNQTIAYRRTIRRTSVFGFVWPAAWDTVSAIEVPQPVNP